MRGRCSRKLGLLPKAFFLVWLLWLAYLIMARSSSSSSSSSSLPRDGEYDGVDRKRPARQLEDLGEEGQLARPVYVKPPADANAPGEWGVAARFTLGPEEKKLEQDSVERYAINIYASDKISLHRHIRDNRMADCRAKKYDYRSLPTTSVVIAFYNEAWSTLLRTVHSVLESTPATLLREVILVDDFSDRGYLQSQLEEYMSKLERVRLIRTNKREGLVRARLIGATYATGDVLTFLDCHCECVPGWIEPLLERIGENKSTIVCPVIDTIDWNTFEFYMQTDEPMIGGFDWRLTFQWHAVPEVERKRRKSHIDPIRSPTMAGGLFAVSKAYFEYLGTYDMGMEVWGGENLELSFRVWQCGGSLEIHPCSHVGHVFPKKAPYARPNFLQNTVRAAEVWMDSYKEHFYNRNPPAKKERTNHKRISNPSPPPSRRQETYGDISKRVLLRDRLKCNSFDWYLKNIYPDLHVPEDRAGWHGAYFEYTSQREIRFNSVTELCAEVPDGQTHLKMSHCPHDGESRPPATIWDFRDDGTIYHPHSDKCVTAYRTPEGRSDTQMRRCSPGDQHQHWKFEW
ncbi:Polypeptide N-acetylgalactosaminyltransferase 4 [Merluccius polli]|uniref:Polypeptide N-acetylgalactosaminyltransferase n=1 Tax=Merluccius polli TaxID=89951 RepID=A0AA47MR35_MERPO|nr:Polypeptide N-acetylgalactosaminyltransferase 4 [Merluccius polli]